MQQSREEMEVLFTFFAERYERRSLLVSSNLVFSQWAKIFQDPMTTMAAIDRLVPITRSSWNLTARVTGPRATKHNELQPQLSTTTATIKHGGYPRRDACRAGLRSPLPRAAESPAPAEAENQPKTTPKKRADNTQNNREK